ncbi:MAG: hypothetical protein LBC90_08175, partial [Candidatus Adiutrix sp.]|nr:hypothetical protein [Candidatus Adiutrix sp.]
AVIDEKLIRMKELAEQAATGTYTTVQREIINSEYQAMAAEIDRIATATNFNGVKLLDGSISAIHHGMGLKLHFGTGNDPAEDYYFVKMGDVRATSQSGLRIGGDAKNDIWGTVGTHGGPNTTGCCGGGIPSLNEPVPGWKEGEVFSFGYNWDWKAQDGAQYDNGAPALKGGRYIAGAWQVDATPTLQELMDLVNQGSQARVRIDFEYKAAKFTLAQSGYPALDLTAYASALSTNCGIDKNYRITDHISAIMSTSAKPPSICFVNGEYWPPASAFIYSVTSGWLTNDANRYQVSFNNFNTAALANDTNPPSYTIDDGGPTVVWMNDTKANGGAGLTWNANGYWEDDNGDLVPLGYFKITNSVEPVFTLPDGQIVSRDLVAGNSKDGFSLILGTGVVKTQAGGTTLADLLGRTSAANPAYSSSNVIVDAAGNAKYKLTAGGATLAGTGNSGDAVTSDIMNALLENGLAYGFTTFQDLLDFGNILPRTLGSPNPVFSAQNVLADENGNAQYVLDIAGSASALARLNMLMPAGSPTLTGNEPLTSAMLDILLGAGWPSPNVNTYTSIAELMVDFIQPNPATGTGAFNAASDALIDRFGQPRFLNDVFDPDNIAGVPDFFGNRPVLFDLISLDGGAHRFCFGNGEVETYYIGSATLGASSFSERTTAAAVSLSAALNDPDSPFGPGRSIEDVWAISALAYAINNNPDSQFWARLEGIGLENGGEGQYRDGYTTLYVFAKDGGAKGNSLNGCDEQLGDIRGSVEQYNRAVWYNDEFETSVSAGTYFSNGGKEWGVLRAVPTGYGSWGVQLHGQDVGRYRDLWILNVGEAANSDIRTGQKDAFTGQGFGYTNGQSISNLLGLDRAAFVEVQNADDGPWAGAHLRTQSDAQEALDAIQGAIERKDKVRATLGAYINRLENTITNLEIQAENLQASESRISDVDLATEMTNFVKNQVLTQAAVSMLSQANSLPQMALSLLNR